MVKATEYDATQKQQQRRQRAQQDKSPVVPSVTDSVAVGVAEESRLPSNGVVTDPWSFATRGLSVGAGVAEEVGGASCGDATSGISSPRLRRGGGEGIRTRGDLSDAQGGMARC